MSRKTLPLTVLLLLSGGLGAAGCTGEDTDDGRKPPEICDDGIDNDDDGKIDCDDEAECGGPQCDPITTDTDPPTELDPVEILFNPAECCNFTFGAGECPKLVGTFQAVNRELDADGEVHANCDLIGGDPPLSWSVPGCPNCPLPFLDSEVAADTTVTVEVWFDCAVTQTFEATCRADIKLEPFEDVQEFTVNGVRQDP